MKFIFLIFLIPLLSFSQNDISVFVNGNKIENSSECPFYTEFGEHKINLLDSNLFQFLLVQDSFYINGVINEINFTSNSFKLFKKVKDSIIVSLTKNINKSEVGIQLACGNSIDSIYHKIEIQTIRNTNTFYISSFIRSFSYSFKPAYYLDGKPIFDEDPKLNKELIKKHRKEKRRHNFKQNVQYTLY